MAPLTVYKGREKAYLKKTKVQWGMTACPWGASNPMQAKWKCLPLARVLSEGELALGLLAFPQPSLSFSALQLS